MQRTVARGNGIRSRLHASRIAGGRQRAMKKHRTADDIEADIAPYRQESLLIDAIPQIEGGTILCTSAGLAQFAASAAQALPTASVTCTFLDLYRANLAAEHWKDSVAHVQISCAMDLPNVETDV